MGKKVQVHAHAYNKRGLAWIAGQPDSLQKTQEALGLHGENVSLRNAGQSRRTKNLSSRGCAAAITGISGRHREQGGGGSLLQRHQDQFDEHRAAQAAAAAIRAWYAEGRKLNRLLTEDGAAWSFAACYAEQVRFCHSTKAWFVWNGTEWRRDSTRQLFYAIGLFVRALAQTTEKVSVRTEMGRAAFVSNVERLLRSDQTLVLKRDDPGLVA
jgi:hypothetical protein